MMGTEPDTVLGLIRAVDEADSAQKLLQAVRVLAAAGSVAAIPKLIQVLGFNNPGAAVAAVDGLIALGKPAVLPLMEQLDGYNYGARAWAIRGLSGIGDPRGLEILLKASASDFALSVRRAAARGLGVIHWEWLGAEEVPGAQERTLETLLQTSQDPEWVVRYAAIVGLEGLAKGMVMAPDYWLPAVEGRLKQMLVEDETLGVRGRVKLAMERLNLSSNND